LFDAEALRTSVAIARGNRVVAPPFGGEQPKQIGVDLRLSFPFGKDMDDGPDLLFEVLANGSDVFGGAVIVAGLEVHSSLSCRPPNGLFSLIKT
jgi:hypothetical protein